MVSVKWSSVVCIIISVGWWFVNVDNCHEGWVPATFLEPLGDADQSKPEKLTPGKGMTS